MAEALDALAAHAGLWRWLVWASAVYVLALGGLMLVRPAIAARFLDGHAATAPLNALEAALRFIIGLAFMGASGEMRFETAFFWFGALLAATAVPMAFLPGLHKRFARWSVPMAKPFLPVLGMLALALGAMLVWALS